MLVIFHFKVLLLLLRKIINILYLSLFYFKHILSISLSLFCYKFIFKYLKMNLSFSF
jgi:hypothetical protein